MAAPPPKETFTLTHNTLIIDHCSTMVSMSTFKNSTPTISHSSEIKQGDLGHVPTNNSTVSKAQLSQFCETSALA